MNQEYENNNAVRPCGGGFEYCDGNCDQCTINNFTYSNETEKDEK